MCRFIIFATNDEWMFGNESDKLFVAVITINFYGQQILRSKIL